MIALLGTAWHALGPRVSYALLAALVAYGAGQWQGRSAVHERWRIVEAKREAMTEAWLASAAHDRVRTVTEFRTRTVHIPGEVREVVKYVEAQPRDCIVRRGTVELFNAGLENRLPVARPGVDDSPSGVAANTIAGHLYTELRSKCAVTAERLRALQDYVASVGKPGVD